MAKRIITIEIDDGEPDQLDAYRWLQPASPTIPTAYKRHNPCENCNVRNSPFFSGVCSCTLGSQGVWV